MTTPLEQFYLEKKEPLRSTLVALRDILLEYDPKLTAKLKYRMPCFCYIGKALCYLWVDKLSHEPYILWVDGKLMDFPQLEQGDRSRMKILRMQADKDLPVKLIHELLSFTIQLRKKPK